MLRTISIFALAILTISEARPVSTSYGDAMVSERSTLAFCIAQLRSKTWCALVSYPGGNASATLRLDRILFWCA